jgi:ribosomal protein S14
MVSKSKLENRCAHCGGQFGLIRHQHWALRFCRKACKDNFRAKSAKDHARTSNWLGFR